MNKGSENINTDTSNISVSDNLILNPKYYQLLISNKWVSFRIKLADKLDELFIPPIGYTGWKQRFLYPNKIPKKDYAMISSVMQEYLAFFLEQQKDSLIIQINEKSKFINKLQSEVEKLEYIISESEKAVKIYNDGKEN